MALVGLALAALIPFFPAPASAQSAAPDPDGAVAASQAKPRHAHAAKVRVRIGTSYTESREDRFSNLVDLATYHMWAIDGGFKWNGLAINGQYYWRRINDFTADGPLPLVSTLDRGGELSVGHFVTPKTVMVYSRGSWVRGEFRNNAEYGGGVKWYSFPPSGCGSTARYSASIARPTAAPSRRRRRA